jgi:hypothetical protein
MGTGHVELRCRAGVVHSDNQPGDDLGGQAMQYQGGSRYAERINAGLKEWHRQREEFYARRGKPLQLDREQVERGAVSPLGGVAVREQSGRRK